MALVLWIIRILVLLLLLRIVLRLLFPPASPQHRRRPNSAPGQPPERLGGELVRDPNCGTYIPKARAIAAGSGVDVKYFCSTECQHAWTEKHK